MQVSGNEKMSKQKLETPPFALTARELVVLQSTPAGLELLIDWHEEQATLADGMDMPDSTRFHDERKEAIRKEVARLEALIDR